MLANLQVGIFEYVDTNYFTAMNSTDHCRASDVQWDPTGRYVFKGVSAYKIKEDHDSIGYFNNQELLTSQAICCRLTTNVVKKCFI